MAFSRYVSALAPKFCTKNARVNVDEIDGSPVYDVQSRLARGNLSFYPPPTSFAGTALVLATEFYNETLSNPYLRSLNNEFYVDRVCVCNRVVRNKLGER